MTGLPEGYEAIRELRRALVNELQALMPAIRGIAKRTVPIPDAVLDMIDEYEELTPDEDEMLHAALAAEKFDTALEILRGREKRGEALYDELVQDELSGLLSEVIDLFEAARDGTDEANDRHFEKIVERHNEKEAILKQVRQ